MTEEDEKVIQEQISALGDLHRTGKLDADTYHKCLVATAHQYSELGAHIKAAAVVHMVPLEYFKTIQRQHMAEDPVYAKVAYELALGLVQNGLIHMGSSPLANMPGANA